MEIEEERVLLADQDLTEEEIEFFYQYKCFSDEAQQELDIKYYNMAVVNGADWINTWVQITTESGNQDLRMEHETLLLMDSSRVFCCITPGRTVLGTPNKTP